jgi:hypothetical protein
VDVRLIGTLGLVLLVVAGCAPAPAERAQGRTLVGKWQVTGESTPITQVFDDKGGFRSEAKSEIMLSGQEKVEAVIVLTGQYRYDGRKLYTTAGAIDVKGLSEGLRANLVKNARENIGKSRSAVLEWKSDEELVAKQEDGKILRYVKK